MQKDLTGLRMYETNSLNEREEKVLKLRVEMSELVRLKS